MKEPLAVELLVEPRAFALGAKDQFRVGLTVTNVGSEPIDPRLYDASLWVNGRRSRAWDMAVQNGVFDPTQTMLAPTASVTAQWPLADALFPQPGSYELVLKYRSSEARATVEVSGEATAE